VRDYSEYIFQKPPPSQDNRPWWVRLLSSIRPTIGAKGKVDAKTGKKKLDVVIGVKGGVDF
jgi:hypothetical protein